MMTDSVRARRLLDRIADGYRDVLGGRLVGVYEHGSLAFGCFRWAVSDVDFLVVVQGGVSDGEKEAMIRLLLGMRDAAPLKGFEMSVVRADVLKPFTYPTPYELHYSEAWHEAFTNDLSGCCARMNGTDPDLAAHCAVIRSVGRTVTGDAVGSVFGDVPEAAYLDSIHRDIQDAREDILNSPVSITLNLCRVLAAVRTGAIFSKAQGGQWALKRLDSRWKGIISGALEAYAGDGRFEPERGVAEAFAGFMMREIDQSTIRGGF